jgi:hypothetical protein
MQQIQPRKKFTSLHLVVFHRFWLAFEVKPIISEAFEIFISGF